MPQSLRDALSEYPRIMLEAIAESWGIVLTDEQMPEIVERLVAEMVNPASVQFVLRRLGEPEREALAYVATTGQVKAHVMARQYGSIRRLGPGRLEWEAAWRKPISAAERLWFLGLICREYAQDERYHGDVFDIPAELRAALPPLSIELPVFHVEPAPGPRVTHDDGDDLAHDIFVVLSYVRRHQVRARPRAPESILTKRELAGLHHRLRGAKEEQRLRFLVHLCARAGLIGEKGGLWTASEQAAAWLRDSDVARQRALFRAWLDDVDWNELWLMPGVYCEETGWRNDPLLPRRVVLEYLRQCPAAAWWTIASFVDSLHGVAPDLLRPDGDYDSWYIRDVPTGQYLLGWSSWPRVEGALIRYLLRYPLRWLGVVAVGQPEGETEPGCFMLTQQGAAILGTDPVAPGRPQRMIVQADLQVLVPRGASWYDRFLLERLAQWVGEKDGVVRYRMAGETVRAYLASGVTVEQVLAFLRRVTGNRLPPEVTRTLQSWATGSP